MGRYRAEHRHAGGIDSVEADARGNPDLQAFIDDRRAALSPGESVVVADRGALGASQVTSDAPTRTVTATVAGSAYGPRAEAALREGIAAAEGANPVGNAVVLMSDRGSRRFERRRGAWLEVGTDQSDEGAELERHEAPK